MWVNGNDTGIADSKQCAQIQQCHEHKVGHKFADRQLQICDSKISI